MKGLVLASAAVLGSGLGLKTYVDDRVEVNQSIHAAREGIVVVRIPGGNINVEGWDRNEVQVTGTIPAGEDRFELTSDHGHVEIRIIPDLNADPAETDLTIMVPERSSLDIETDGAEVSVDAVTGVVRLATHSGDIRVAGDPMGIVVRSQSGDIEIAAERTPGIAHSEEGTVRLRGGAKDLIADRLDRRTERRLRRLECRRSDDCDRLVQSAQQYGRNLGADISSMVQDLLQDLDLHFSMDDYGDGFTFEFSGDVGIDSDDLQDLFEDMEDFFQDFGEEFGDSMVELADDLEELGEDLRDQYRDRRQDRRGR